MKKQSQEARAERLYVVYPPGGCASPGIPRRTACAITVTARMPATRGLCLYRNRPHARTARPVPLP